MEDILARVILAIFYASAVVPLIGDTMLGSGISSYRDSWRAGAALHAVIIMLALVLFSVLWAYVKIST